VCAAAARRAALNASARLGAPRGDCIVRPPASSNRRTLPRGVAQATRAPIPLRWRQHGAGVERGLESPCIHMATHTGLPCKKISRPLRRLSIPPARATTGAAPSSRAARARVASGGGRGGVPRRRPGRHPAADPPRARVVGPLTVPLVTQRGMQGPPLLAVDAKLNGPPRRRRRWVRPPARPRHVGGPPRGRSRAH